MRVNCLFKWYDFWIGFFWDRYYRKLYFLPIPMIGICIHFASPGFENGVKAYLGGANEYLVVFEEDWFEGYQYAKNLSKRKGKT